MTNQEIWKIALQQSAYDFGCAPEDFVSGKNLVVRSRTDKRARKYLPLPFACDMVSYGSNIVAQTNEALEAIVLEYIETYAVSHAFETPNIHALEEKLRPFGLAVCFMAEYFLPDVEQMQLHDCDYALRVLQPADFAHLYTEEWSDALCKDRKELDVLAVGAYDGETLVGLAGCSADCEAMYQIGVNVLPAYRKQGIAAAVTAHLADEILKLGKVPFYCAASCNIASVRNAIKCGFRPAWAELTARETDFIKKMNARP